MSTVQVISESVDDVYTGSKTVGTSAVVLGSHENLTRGVEVTTPAANTAVVYISNRSSITAGTTDTLDGYAIAPGASVFFPSKTMTTVYLVSTDAGQKISFLAY